MSFLLINRHRQSVHLAIGNWHGVLSVAEAHGFAAAEKYQFNGTNMPDGDAATLATVLKKIPPDELADYIDLEKRAILVRVLRGGGVFLD